MPFNTERLAKQIAEMSEAYQRQINRAGQPGYDPDLTELLKKDLSWLKEQEELANPVSTEEKH